MLSSYGFYAIFGILTLVSYWVNQNLQKKMTKYGSVPLPFSGKDVAERMLRENGINDVKVVSTGGALTDHYNPGNKTVNLSTVVYDQRTITAAAVAAHECGHAVQHATGYAALKMRSALVPAVNFSNKITPWVLTIGVFLVETFPALLGIGIVLFCVTALFSLITLPVEINASQRAVAWLDKSGITDANTKPMVVDALKSAAYTYVIAAVSSLATVLHYVLILMNRRR
ncbi:MAG TPA: hypothetical protein DEO38_03620 [Bacteroidales bacterium]|nr:hypothetical protein [Bacteroidales bacterium]